MQNQYNQTDVIIDDMLDNASELRRLIEEDIMEAFPLVESISGLDGNYTHASSDFPLYGVFYSEIEDALAVYEITKKIKEIILGTRVIIKHLFPNELRNGMMTVTLGKDFDGIIDMLDENLKKVDEIAEDIRGSQDSSVTECLNLAELRRLNYHFIVLGWKLIKNGFEVPEELKSSVAELNNKQVLQQIEQAVTPHLIQLAASKIPKTMQIPKMNQLSSRAMQNLSATKNMTPFK